MDVVILADFCGNLDRTQSNGRFLYISDMISERDQVEIITSDFCHASKSHFEKKLPEGPHRVTMLHEPGYPKNVCLKRFYSHFVWGKNVKKYLAQRKKPDVIYCAIPTLTAAYEAAKYCKRNDVKFIIDIQDLWPEAFKMVFRMPLISNLLFAPFKLLANKIYKQADEVIAVSDTYVDRALSVNKKCQSGHTVFLGTNLNTFDNNAKSNFVEKPNGEIWLAYCGTLGESYDLTYVMDAIALVREKGFKPPKFIVMGRGPRKEEFESYAREKGIDAVFTGRLPYDKMCGMLCACDITVNPIARGSAASIINKHSDYAASGLPVLNTQECQEYQNLVAKYDMGFNCANDNSVDLAEKLIALLEDKDLRHKMGKNARRCAEERFDRGSSYTEIVACIESGTLHRKIIE